MSEKIPRCVWLVDSNPADVNGSDVVSVPSEVTLSTMETFTITVSFGDKTAFWTGSTCIFWIDIDNWYSQNFGFVFDEVLQLVEAPRVDYSSLSAALNRYPSSDALQVFKGYSSESVFSLLNNPFADGVIDCSNESMLFSVSFLEEAFSGFCAFALEFAPDFLVSRSYSVEFFSCPPFSVTICCNISDSDVYADKISCLEGFCLWGFYYGCKIECSVSENKVCLSSDSVHSCFLVVSDSDGNLQSSVKCEYGCFFESLPAKDSLVVDHSPVWLEGCFGFSVDFVGVCDFADCSNSHLCRKIEMFSYVIIDKVMELPVVKRLSLKSCFGDTVASFVEGFHCLLESLELCFGWNKFNQERLLHNCMDISFPYLTVSPIPPPNKLRGFLGGFL